MEKLTIELNKHLKSIIDQRGGADYAAAVLYHYIANYDMANYLELETAGMDPEAADLFERLAEGIRRL